MSDYVDVSDELQLEESTEVDALLEALSLDMMKDNITSQITGESASVTDFLGIVTDKFYTWSLEHCDINFKEEPLKNYPKDKFIVFDNEPCDYVKIFSPKFDYNEKVVMMRSPHTGDFSIVVAQNKYNPEVANEIEKYIDLGDNLCIVDNTKKAFQDLTAGSDLDLI